MATPKRAVFALGIVLVASACASGETNMAAIERLRPRGRALRAELREIRMRLPPPGSVRAESAPAGFVPPLVFDRIGKRFTADVLMVEHLDDPELDLPQGYDLMLSHDIHHCLRWTGPKNPLDESVWDERGNLGRECDEAFARPWLIVVRHVRWDLPRRIEMEVFVVDRASRGAVASIPVHLALRQTRSESGAGLAGARELEAARSSAYAQSRCAVARKLAALPGATIDLRESWLGSVRDDCRGSEQGAFVLVEPNQIAD